EQSLTFHLTTTEMEQNQDLSVSYLEARRRIECYSRQAASVIARSSFCSFRFPSRGGRSQAGGVGHYGGKSSSDRPAACSSSASVKICCKIGRASCRERVRVWGCAGSE